MTVPVRSSDGRTDTTVTGVDQEVVYGQPGTVPVTVDPATATGSVTLKDGDTVLGSGALEDGEAEVALAAGSLPVGTHDLTLAYAGDTGHSGSTGSVEVTVTKATPNITATPTPASVEVNDGTSSIAVTVSATGVDPSGTVTASVDGDVVDTQSLVDGAATLTVGPFATAGDETVTIDYSGDASTSTGSTTTSVTVTEPTPPAARRHDHDGHGRPDGLWHRRCGRRDGRTRGGHRVGPAARRRDCDWQRHPRRGRHASASRSWAPRSRRAATRSTSSTSATAGTSRRRTR